MEKQSATIKRGLLSDAVQAIRMGQKAFAHEILADILQEDPQNEHAYIWSAAIAETREEAIRCLERVLRINPQNALAANALAAQRLERHEKAVEKTEEWQPRSTPRTSFQAERIAEMDECPLCGYERKPNAVSCRTCGGYYSIHEMPKKGISGDAVNERLIEESIRKWQLRLELETTFDAYMNIALGHLNLSRSGEALGYLWRAWALRTQDARLRQFNDQLAAKKLILVVDDSSTVRRLVSISLERQGYRVRTAVNGLDGLKKFEEEMPDLLLTDIMMPEMDGYELCRMLKRNPSAKRIPILMLTGNEGLFDKVRGKMAGATDYLTKPFHSDVLLKAVDRFLQVDAEKTDLYHLAPATETRRN
jgi:twitching motility two-component system response regulator PilG